MFSLPVFFSGIRSKGFFRNVESVSDAVSLRVSVLHRKKQKVGHHRIGETRSPFNLGSCNYRYGKTGNKKRSTCFETLQQNELNSDVAHFATHSKPIFQQIRFLTGLNIGSKTRNIAIQLVLQQRCITSCTFLRVARFSVP